MEQVYATIITIGDELLIGQVIDTNSAWMAQELNKAGIWLKRRVSVGDSKEEIISALNEESRDVPIILITGGLGPTADDITKPVLSEYFGGGLVVDQQVLDHVQYLFEKVFRRPFTERNRKQAEVPDVCTVLHNERGTAPGMWFEKDGKIFVSLPGVPHEMKGLMLKEVLPRLKQHFTMPSIAHRTLLTAGIGESTLADVIQQWEEQLPANCKLAYLPNYGMVRLRITASDTSNDTLNKTLDDEFAKLKELVKEWLVAEEDISLEETLGHLLKQQHRTMGTAESCTGGYIAHRVTSIPGSSAYYKGSIISYANEIKENVLHVQHNTLQQHGAVSEATIQQMVHGALTTLNVDYVVATSGIMGPDGGTSEKPVGTVWIAAGNRTHIVTKLLQLHFDRQRNIDLTASQAMDLLRKFIKEH